ncbi:MFS transporter [Rathayibacter sp. VKM Ac-2801]|uniref:MFS transporter n=1 Tax=Rathayibacter sp. VKM Ac-2801 TaxID=2609255 RepID=UPI0013201860|nr:MFS transporter [Rathayibacter sp. VKM Ac-2801]QHC69373.1 MFS transporter [Rathayibacter sp. VKM Ac-2801]
MVNREAKRLQRSGQGPVVLVLALAGLCSSVMFTLVVPIQARLPELLNASRDDTAWVVTATLLTATITTPISGRLGDMYGKRRIVLLLLAVLTIGSVVAALSPDVVGLICGRALQGAVVGVIPLGISILRDVLDPRRVASAIALVSATLGVGGALGLPFSAYIVQYTDWHWLFWASGGLGALVFLLVLWVVPASTLRTGGRFDWIGAIGLAAGLTGLLLAVTRGSSWGWTSPLTLGLAVGGVVVLLAWGRFELSAAHPLLDLRVAARRPVLLTNLVSIGVGFAYFTSNVTFPQILEMPSSTEIGYGLTPLQAGLVVMPSGLVMMALSPVSGRLARTVGPKALLIAGVACLVLAYGFTLLVAEEVWHLVVTNILIGAGIGFGYAAMPLLIMQSVSPEETGASNGMNALARSLGSSVSAAIIGLVLAGDTTDVGGVSTPTSGAFQTSYLWGLVVAVCALVIGVFIPRKTPGARGIPQRREAVTSDARPQQPEL